MLFFQMFQQLAENQAQVQVELKNDVCIIGTLQSVDQYLNVKLRETKVKNPEKYPHLVSLKNCFIRGSVVRYIHLAATSVDTKHLHDQCRREAKAERSNRKTGTN